LPKPAKQEGFTVSHAADWKKLCKNVRKMSVITCNIDIYISYKGLTKGLQTSQKTGFLQLVGNVRNLLDGNCFNNRLLRCFSYNLTGFMPFRLLFIKSSKSYKGLTKDLQTSQKTGFLQLVGNVRNLLDGNCFNNRLLRCFSYNLTGFMPFRLLFVKSSKNITK